jgi:hypothetical protein
MNTVPTLLCDAVLASLAACQARTPEPSASTPPAATVSTSSIGKAMDEAAKKLATENITLRTDDGGTHKAEITPAGDLIIDGKTVAIDATQRQLLLDYRARVHDIAQAGMQVGAAGAELAGKAVTEALGSIFSGHPDDVGKRVEAQAQGIKTAARGLCDRLPAMFDAQAKVVAAIPEFAPFAKTQDRDVQHCKQDVDAHDAPAPSAPPAPTA